LPGKVALEQAHGMCRYPTARLGSIVVNGKLPMTRLDQQLFVDRMMAGGRTYFGSRVGE
jgi:hypothetical protein